MPSATPPALPADLMRSIARATLAAEEGNKVKARVRLSLVDRAWRDTLHGAHFACARRLCTWRLLLPRHMSLGNWIILLPCPALMQQQPQAHCSLGRLWLADVPLHMDLDDAELFSPTQKLSAKRLTAVLRSGCFGSVDLVERLSRSPPPPTVPMLVTAALLGSTSTLTELHGLPLVKPEEQPQAGLMLFSRLRSLTLLHTWDGLSVLRLAALPASVEELTLTLTAPFEEAPISLPSSVTWRASRTCGS